MKLQELAFLSCIPFFVFDRAIKVIVVSLAALFATSVLDVKLFLKKAGYLCPFLNASVLIQLFQGVVLLSKSRSTTTVQAFLSVIAYLINL